MNNLNLISIDPAQSAKPALNPEVFERIARECRFTRDVKTYNISALKSINFAFGIKKQTSRTKSIVLFSLRSLFGCGLIAFSFFNNSVIAGIPSFWVTMSFGILLLFGMFTRLSSVVATGFFAFAAVLSSAIIPMEIMNIGLAAIAFLFVVFGPGKFSADQIIRKSLIKYSNYRSRTKAEQLAKLRLSYKAMRYV